MFSIVKSIKKIVGIGKRDSPKQEESTKDKVIDKLTKVSHFVENKIQDGVAEYHVIREKMKDLSQTNYDLAMRHLEKGNLSEAIFRFKIVKKFWPDKYEAYYQLAYCLIIVGKFKKAKLVIAELLEKNPDYKDKVAELLNSIENEEKELRQ